MISNRNNATIALTGLLGLLLAQQGSAAYTPNFLPEQEQLEKNQALWISQGIESYQFEYEESGTAVSAASNRYPFPWAVTINPSWNPGAALAVDANFVDLPAMVPIPSVNELFSLILDEINANTDRDIYVAYDSRRGFPTHIHFLRSDGSVYDVEVSSFMVLGDGVVTTPSPTPGPTLTIQQQLTNARALWQSRNVLNYSYKFNMFGSNPQHIVYPWTVTVSNGNQVLAVDGNNNQINWMNNNPHPMSMVELFDTIQIAINLSPQYISVIWNRDYGYPEDIYIVHDEQVPDATVDAHVSEFTLRV